MLIVAKNLLTLREFYEVELTNYSFNQSPSLF